MNTILVVMLMAMSTVAPQQKKPPVLKATASAHQVALAWTASTDGAANPTLGYNVYRGTASGGEGTTAINSSLVGVGCSSATTCVYTDTTVLPGTYYYTVKASLNAALSAPSNEVQAIVPLAAPTGLTATAQ
jgi:hypothetical protein